MEKIVKNSSTVYKIISVLIAVILWAYVAFQENTEMTWWVRNVPITIVGTEILDQNGYYITETDQSTIDVKIKGERSVLAKVTAADITAILDVSTVIAAGSTTLSCDVSVDKKNVDISDTRKNSIVVTAEKITTDIYPVSTNIVGAPAKGYGIFEPSTNPTEVTVRGSESIVGSIASVSTKSVSVSGVSSSNSVTVGLTAFDADGKAVSGVTFEPASVEVSYTVLKEKSVSLVVPLIKVPYGKKVTYEPQTVKIYAAPEDIASVTEVRTEAVDVSLLEDGGKLSLSLSLPYGVYASEQGGDIVAVTFKIEDIEAEVSNDEE